MKKWFLVGGGVSAAALAAMVLWSQEPASSKDREEDREEGAAKAVAPSSEEDERPSLPPPDPEEQKDVAVTIDELLADGSTPAWNRAIALYKGADDDAKRKILQHAAKLPELGAALGTVLATVGDDYTLVEDDRMIEEAAELLKGRWEKPDDLNYGRNLMLAQKTEKRKWVMAKAMITFAKDVGPDSEFATYKQKLETKLIDVHATVQDPFIRTSIIEGMRELGANDVALVMAKGPNVEPEELELYRNEQAEMQKTLDSMEGQRTHPPPEHAR